MNLFIESAKHQGFSIPLHALRGLAAVIVLLAHIQVRITESLPDFALALLFNGGAAVTFFFVLSGLVVGASLAKGGLSKENISLYFHRRFFRIMPLMFCTVTIGGLYLLFIDPHMQYSLNPAEFGELTPLKFIAGYVGYSLKTNPPVWSIFVEIIGSLLIPVMLLSGTKLRYIFMAIAACIALSLIPIEFKHYWHYFMISFYMGLTILLWGKWLARIVERLPTPIFWLMIATLVISFYLPRLIVGVSSGHFFWLVYWETLCITPLIGMIYYLPGRFSLLNAPVFKFLGDVSFSLYLTHSLLLIVLFNLVTAVLGTGAFAVAVFCISTICCCFVVANLSFHSIEMGGVRIGEHLRSYSKPVTEAS